MAIKHTSWVLLLLVTLLTFDLANVTGAPKHTKNNKLVKKSSDGNKNLHKDGVLGGSVYFAINLKQYWEKDQIELKWKGKTGNPLLIAESQLNNTVVVNERFRPQLEWNETMVRIRNLMLEDTGNFTVHVKRASGDVRDKTFSLVVYETAPAPRILPSDVSISPEGCNVTLQCQVAGTKGFNISWEEIPSWGYSQQSNNGTYLHLFLWANYSDTNITCSSSNPADKKDASIRLFNICSNASQTWRYYLLVLLLIPVVAAAGLGSWMWKKKRKKKSATTAFNFKKKEMNTPEALYENIEQKRPHTGDQPQAKDSSPSEVVYENIGTLNPHADERYQHQPIAGTMVSVPTLLYNQVLPR